MAKLYSFAYKDWNLGRDKHKAIAVRGKGNDRQKVQLGVPYRPEAAARAALIAYVDSLERMTHKGDPQIDVVLDKYLEKLEVEGKEVRTVVVRATRLRSHFGKLACSSITDTLCQTYAKAQHAQQYAPTSIHSDLQLLRTALKWTHEKRRDLLSFPAHTACWNVLAPKSTRRELTPEQVHELLSCATSAHIRLFIILAIFTSARLQAITDLKWSQIDFDKRVIDFRIRQDVRDIVSKAYKKGRSVVHMADFLFTALKETHARAQTPYVLEYQGNHSNRIAAGFRAARQRAGLPEWVTPHVLRHTAATWADADGAVPVETVARLLGHSDPNTTRSVYVHPEAAATKPAVEQIEKRFGRGLRVVKG